MNKMVVVLGERIPLDFSSYLHPRGTAIASSFLMEVLGRARRGLGRDGVVDNVDYNLQPWNKRISWSFFCPREGDWPVPVLAGNSSWWWVLVEGTGDGGAQLGDVTKTKGTNWGQSHACPARASHSCKVILPPRRLGDSKWIRRPSMGQKLVSKA